jgi:hypothetical protein
MNIFEITTKKNNELVLWLALPDNLTIEGAPDFDDPDGPEFQAVDTRMVCNEKLRPGVDFVVKAVPQKLEHKYIGQEPLDLN